MSETSIPTLMFQTFFLKRKGTAQMLNKKSRILQIKHYLEEYADELNPVTMPQIISHLEKGGISASRKTIMQDISQLMDSGIDVIRNTGHSHEYFIGERHFELPELKLLIDAVAASGFITPRKSAKLIGKLTAFASENQRLELNRQLYVNNQIKSETKNIYHTIDLLHSAINKYKQVTFKYYEYNQHKIKEYKHRRHIYIFSPYALLWNNDRYYTVGFSDKHNKVIAFRVDRIASPKLTDNSATPQPADFDISMYSQSIFQMYEGEGLQKVTLKCENDLMKNVIDRFGIDIETEIIDEEHFAATVEVSASPTFYGWVFLFGGRMKITAPNSVIEEYRVLAMKAIE